MRFIDMEQVFPRIRELMGALADAHDELMREASHDGRAAVMERRQPCWTALRPAFEAQSSGKCWYTECRSPGADNDIDHFRPKLSVNEEAGHPGYYWLAFEWRNMRLSCQRANRRRREAPGLLTGGKGDHFPLLNGSPRARGPGDDINLEVPLLLDPTNPADPALLSFKPNGEVDLSPEFKGLAFAEAKFEATRLYLHLNWPKFRDARVMLYNRIERMIQRGAREAPQAHAAIPSANDRFKDAIRDLVAAMSVQEEYSAAARVYVESFGHVWWIRDVVLRLL